jgi:ATP-binding cassette subfamily E protein 1
LNISYKPQKISPKFQGTVRQLIQARIREASVHPQFNTDVLKPLQIENIMDQEVLNIEILDLYTFVLKIFITNSCLTKIFWKVGNLSGGELQRVALTICLGKPADVYLIDEPSAYLDSEQRLHAAKVIKRSISWKKHFF